MMHKLKTGIEYLYLLSLSAMSCFILTCHTLLIIKNHVHPPTIYLHGDTNVSPFCKLILNEKNLNRQEGREGGGQREGGRRKKK